MASGFSSSVKLTGESEYKKALNDITNQLKMMSSEMKLTASTFQKGDNAMETMKNKSKVLNEQIEIQATKIHSIRDALRMSIEAYGESDKRTVQWKAKLMDANVELNNLLNSLDENEKNMKEYAKATEEASQGSSRLGDIIKGQLISEAIIIGVKALGNAMVSVGKQLVDIGKQAISSYATYEQLVGGVQTLFGESSNTVMEYARNAYKTAGLSANEYMDQVTSFSASLLQSLNWDTEKSAKIADVAINDMADNANKMGTSMEMIQNAYQGFAKQNYTMLDNLKLGYGGTKGEMERLIADANAINASMGIYSDYQIGNMSDMIEAIHVIQQAMGFTGTTALEAEKTIEGSTRATQASWKNLVAGIADENANLGELVDAFVNNLVISSQNMLPRIAQAVSGVGQLIAGLGQALLDNLPLLIEKGKELLLGIGSGITQAIPSIVPIIQQLVISIGEFIKEQAPLLLQNGMDLITEMGSGLVEGIPEFIDNALNLLQEFADFLTENAPLLIETGITFVRNMIQGIIQSIPELIARVPELISQFANVINDNAPTVLMAGVGLIWDIIKGLISAIPDLIANIPQIIQAILDVWQAVNWLDLGSKVITGIGNGFTAMKDFAKNSMGSVKDAIINFIKDLPSNLKAIAKKGISGLIDGFKSMLGSLKSSAIEVSTNIINSLKSILSWDNLKSIGMNMLKGLWNGISDMTGWLLDKIKGFGDSVLGGIKKFFGIHSPSTVFRDQIGKNLALGLGEGFIGTMRSVSDDMIKAVPTEYEIDPVKQHTTELTGGKLVGAITDALKGVKVVMNDREMGSFVINTVGKVVYS